ncbi:MAG: peptidase C39 family protein, partial [Gammaproteobacteria bacterium]|nr:peptidase C39 family protein [Gammaproteobacteria bacterium]
ADFVVLEDNGQVIGYAILLFRQATKLCRLYSLAVAPEHQGQGHGRALMAWCIERGQDEHCLFLRTEVKADQDQVLDFFHAFGFVHLGLRSDYYDDHSDALVLQKQLHFFDSSRVPRLVPHLTQSTPFTCGPASLLMALAWFQEPPAQPQHEELEIWREATTIYMTSGHGGCGPHGLARAALKRGLTVKVWSSQAGPVLLDSVRNEEKRTVMSRVQEVDIAALKTAGVTIKVADYSLAQLQRDLSRNHLVIALISTYQFDRSKAPHWVLITAIDDEYIYINDPDDDLLPWQTVTERQYLPIPRNTFEKAFAYGTSRLRTAIVVGGKA